MKIYTLLSESNRFWNIEPIDDNSWINEFSLFDGKPFLDWNPVEVRFIRDGGRNKSLRSGDFPSLIPYIPVFSKRALDVLVDVIGKYGQFLPLICEGETYFAFNVTNVLDALDYSLSSVKRFRGSDRIMKVDKYVFREDEIVGEDVFKVSGLAKSEVFVTEKIVELVELNKLLGFDFVPIL